VAPPRPKSVKLIPLQPLAGLQVVLQGEGTIQSFEPVLLNPHGGDLNGFFLIRGEPDKLHAMLASEEWNRHQARALMHLEGSGFVAGVSGKRVRERMQLWSSFIPS